MIKLEVRCCCNSAKLLGWLQVPKLRQSYSFPLRTANVPCGKKVSDAKIKVETIWLDVRTVYVPSQGSHYAIMNREIPMEILRQLPGFEENKND